MYFGKTYFSFKYGTFSTKELVGAAAEAGVPALALTNINSTADTWDFVRHCREQSVKPVLGVEIRNGQDYLYTLLAANNRGFRRINEFLSEHLVDKNPFPISLKTGSLFDEPGDGFVIYPLGGKAAAELTENERIGVQPAEVNRLLTLLDKPHIDKYLIRQPVTFQSRVYYNLHRLLRAIDRNVLLSKLEPGDLAGKNESFLPPGEVFAAFYPYPQLITNTYRMLDACSVSMEFGAYKNKRLFTASLEDDRRLLEKLAWEGYHKRYGRKRVHRERVEKELRIIDQMGFTAYYLITWDMVRYAQGRGFYHVGRGSGANSIVAYCLGITDVDPIELNLYFERFLNPHRTSPPDFDIDFSYKDRDDVIDYMLKRYGKEHAALLGMYPTFQFNAIVRELGKVFGLPKEEIDRLAAEKQYYRVTTREDFNRTDQDRIHRTILHYGKLLQDFPSHFSIHPGGILISEEPLSAYCAVHMPPKGFATTMMDMFVAEDIGLHKLDVLSQRGLGHIKECLEIIKENHRVDIDIRRVEEFKKDAAIKAQLSSGNTIGCFYIESPAMRQLIRKLHCDNYETLVAASSIIRPGVGRSGMMHQYIFRYNNPDKFEYPHPRLKEILGSTYGVMIYQEQVIQVANEWAGFDMAEADMLRRATSSKNRAKETLPALQVKFLDNCRQRGYPEDVSAEIWRQIESFAEYSFCKAHSASFAVESYQSLYLKTYYPKDFAVAVINNFGGFYSRELYFYELMKSGAHVHRPCINSSHLYTSIRQDVAHVGFIHVKNLDAGFVERLLLERERSGLFTSLVDFVERVHPEREQLDILTRTDALRFTGKTKKELLWEGDFLQSKTSSTEPAAPCLFRENTVTLDLPVLPVYCLDDYYDDIELLGFPVGDPFLLADDDPAAYTPAADLYRYAGKSVTVLGYHITHKPVRTVKGQVMSFGTFIDSRKDWIDTVHFPPIHAQTPPGAGFYRITGKVIEDFGMYSIEVTQVSKVGIRQRQALLPKAI